MIVDSAVCFAGARFGNRITRRDFIRCCHIRVVSWSGGRTYHHPIARTTASIPLIDQNKFPIGMRNTAIGRGITRLPINFATRNYTHPVN